MNPIDETQCSGLGPREEAFVTSIRTGSTDLETALRILGDSVRAGFTKWQRLPGIHMSVPSLLRGKQVLASSEDKSMFNPLFPWCCL